MFATNAQSRLASCVFDGVLGPPHQAGTPDGVLIFVVPKATQEASRGLFQGAVSAQKDLEVSETELRELLGGREEFCVSLR